jgi:hypothetical protein
VIAQKVPVLGGIILTVLRLEPMQCLLLERMRTAAALPVSAAGRSTLSVLQCTNLGSGTSSCK